VGRLQFLGGAEQLEYLAPVRPQPRHVGMDSERTTDKLADESDDLGDGDLGSGADVEDLSDVIPVRPERNERIDGIADEDEVTRRRRGTDRELCPGEGLRDDGRDHRALRLAWSIRVERASDHDG